MTEFFDVPLNDVMDFFNGKAIKPGQEGTYPAYGSNGLIGGAPEWKHAQCPAQRRLPRFYRNAAD